MKERAPAAIPEGEETQQGTRPFTDNQKWGCIGLCHFFGFMQIKLVVFSNTRNAGGATINIYFRI